MRAVALAAIMAMAIAPWAYAQPEPQPEAIAVFGADAALTRLTVRGALDIAAFRPAFDDFVATYPDIRLTVEQWNTNDIYARARADCVSMGPSADLIISSAVDQQVRLVNDGCAQSHVSAATNALQPTRNWRNELFGLTSEPAVIVYNRALVAKEDAPASRFDLLDLLRRNDEAFRGRVATYDIERSGIGYLFAFIDSTQATTFGSLIEAFERADAVATCCSAEIIDAVARGEFLIAYNVLGSYAMARAAENPDIAVVTPSDYTLVMSRAALVPNNAANPRAAGMLIDFLLSDPGHRAMAKTFMVTLPATDDISRNPDVLRPVPLSPVLLVGLDQHKRAQLLTLWRKTFPQ